MKRGKIILWPLLLAVVTGSVIGIFVYERDNTAILRAISNLSDRVEKLEQKSKPFVASSGHSQKKGVFHEIDSVDGDIKTAGREVGGQNEARGKEGMPDSASRMIRDILANAEENKDLLDSMELSQAVNHFHDYVDILDELRHKRQEEERKKWDAEYPSESFEERLAEDKDIYGEEDMLHVERLYASIQDGNNSSGAWNELRSNFRDSNFTGCAALKMAELYMGRSDYTKAEKFLHMAIDEYPESQFRNGVSVGPLAVYNLGMVYMQSGRTDEARMMFERLNAEFPDALNGDGTPLSTVANQRLSGIQ